MIHCKRNWIAILLMVLAAPAWAQEKPAEWDLKSCIEYARKQNIQIRQSRLSLEESLENTRSAKAQRLPSLAFSSAHNYVNRPRTEAGDKNTYNGSYDLNSSVTIYQGGQLKKNLQQMELRNQVQALTVEEAENNIELAVTQAFVQVLYADEAVRINANTVEVSKAQRDRGEELMKAGSLSKADFAQLESQYTSDKYQLVVARTSLDNARLELKQLLELDIDDEMKLVIPDLQDSVVLQLLPDKESVYRTSLLVMPEVKYNQLNIQIAGLEKKKAWAGYLPSLRLSAGVGTNLASGTSWGTQMKHNWSENVGLTLSIPIFSNRSVKTSVNIARINVENAELAYENVRKDLLRSVETIYQDAVAAQDRYRSAKENLNAVQFSFNLTQEQFFLGMKNTLEMLIEKNNLLSAQLEMVQAKYMAILNKQLLNFYRGLEIQL
ncbi:MAG: TolC family protein [Odoribacter sp.]|nr:TolC family protein [Odoribacter sp.]